jgi:hypothetical protein
MMAASPWARTLPSGHRLTVQLEDNRMKKTVLTFGLVSGLVVSLMMMLTLPFHDRIGYDRGLVIGYASMVAAFLLIFFGIRSYRDNIAGGTIRFGRALAIGALIALISSLCYTATWEVIYFGGFVPGFMEKFAEHQLADARAKGASEAELQKKAADQKRLNEMYENPAVNAAMTLAEPLPVGLVVALCSAGILSRRRRRMDGEPVVGAA